MVVAVAKWLILGITNITNQNPELFPFYNFVGHFEQIRCPNWCSLVWKYLFMPNQVAVYINYDTPHVLIISL